MAAQIYVTGQYNLKVLKVQEKHDANFLWYFITSIAEYFLNFYF